MALVAALLATFAALSASAPALARGRIVLGASVVGAQAGELSAGRLEVFRLRAHASGRIGGLRLYVDAQSTASSVIVGLYADVRGRAGALLAKSSLRSPRTGAWNTIRLRPRPEITTGGFYWLAVLGDGGTLRYRARTHGRCPGASGVPARTRALARAHGLGTALRHLHCPISAYATASTARTPGKPVAPVPTGLPAPTGLLAPAPGSPAIGGPGSLPSAPPETPVKEPSTEEPPTKEPPPAPTSTKAPTVSGTAVEGHVLLATRGTWTGGPTSYAYQWRACDGAGEGCANIAGATASSYTLTSGDVGHTLRVAVTATNAGGSTSARSAQTALVMAPSGGSSYPECTQTLSQGANVAGAVSGAAAGSVICLQSGEYGSLRLSSSQTGDVTLQASPEAHVTTGRVEISGQRLVLRGLWVDGEVALAAGASFVTLDRNDITGGGEGVVFDTSDCTVPNAPKWAGCEPQAPITDVTMSANRFHDIGENGGEDAIHLDNWRRVTITGNEFDHIVEAGNHTDCVQSVYGGEDLSFDHNWEHDNDCQGFFVKDGDASNVSFLDNLFVRDQIGSYADFAQFWNIEGLAIQHNTIWDGKGMALVTEDATVAPSATIDHNVISNLTVEPHAGASYAITEGTDVFGEQPNKMSLGPGDSILASPQFSNTASDDYRLTSNPNSIGVDWSPVEKQYGPLR